MLLCRVVLALLLLVLLHYCQAKDEGETTQRGAVLVSLTENMAKSAGSQLVQADPFISRNQKQGLWCKSKILGIPARLRAPRDLICRHKMGRAVGWAFGNYC